MMQEYQKWQESIGLIKRDSKKCRKRPGDHRAVGDRKRRHRPHQSGEISG